MTRHSTALLVALLTASGCFRDGAPGVEVWAGAPPPWPLLVRDPGGAAYPASAAPRDLVLVLSAADTQSNTSYADAQTTLAAHLLLLRGQFDAALAARLKSARKSAAVSERTVALQLESVGRELRLSPLAALDPGADYTLFWLAGEVSQAYPLSVSAAPALGARLVETWPSQEAVVAPNLQRALLRFDGDVADDLARHIVLRDLDSVAAEPGPPPQLPAASRAPDDLALPVSVRIAPVRCAALGLPEGDCAWVQPEQALRPSVRYQLALDATLRTRTGALLAAQQVSFTTGPQADHQAPSFVGGRCARDEQPVAEVCLRAEPGLLLVHGALDEAALLTLSSADDATVHSVSALSYASAFELALATSSGASHAVLSARDLAGNAVERTLVYTPAAALAAVSIDEVLADPRGKEPAQEWVELLNSALTPSSLMGFTLSTDPAERGRAITGAAVLAPHERALLVGPDFDARDLADGTLPAGVRVLSLDGSLSIANASATLYLRDALGRRVSTAQVLAPLFAGQCSARPPRPAPGDAAGAARLDGRSDERVFALDPAGACSPGGATSWSAHPQQPPTAPLRSRAHQPRVSTPAP